MIVHKLFCFKPRGRGIQQNETHFVWQEEELLGFGAGEKG